MTYFLYWSETWIFKVITECRSKSTEMRFLKCVWIYTHLTKTDDLQEFIDFSINSVIILLPSIQLFLYFWIQMLRHWLIQNVCHYEAVILRSCKWFHHVVGPSRGNDCKYKSGSMHSYYPNTQSEMRVVNSEGLVYCCNMKFSIM